MRSSLTKRQNRGHVAKTRLMLENALEQLDSLKGADEADPDPMSLLLVLERLQRGTAHRIEKLQEDNEDVRY